MAPAKRGIGKTIGIGCGVIVAVVIGLGAIGLLFGPSPGEKAAAEATEAAKAEASAMRVTAGELWQAYDSNEVAAQATYGDKPLLVTGTIDTIALDFADDPFITFKTGNMFQSAQADLSDEEQAKVSALAKGQQVTVLCTSVSEIAGTPMLRSCRLK